jgi:mycothiol synthase
VTVTLPVRRADRLSSDQVTDVLELAGVASDADGAYPLSEHTVLHVRRGGDRTAIHLFAWDHDRLVAYAHVDTTDPVEGASAELVVHPMFRRRGLGRALVLAATTAATEHDPAGRLRLWAHGDHPSATALAISLGFERTRVLYQMRRSLLAPIEVPVLPDGVTLRPFIPGRDEESWLAVNARAFVDLPDQGHWTLEDLRARMAEPWFDPDGFLLAERGGQLVGFHWTKVHGNTVHGSRVRDVAASDHDHDPIGEVYVLGVDRAAGGLGLGAALTRAGLRHLRGLGLDQAMLYVDGTNTRAVSLYGRLGFVRWSTDVCYRRA